LAFVNELDFTKIIEVAHLEDSESAPSKVAIVIDTLNGGGAEKVCLTLFEAMRGRGVDAQLIVLKQKCTYQLADKSNVHFLFTDEKTRLSKSSVQITASQKLIVLSEEMGGFSGIFSNLDVCHAVVSKANLPNSFYVVHNSIEKSLQTQLRIAPWKYFKRRKAVSVLNGKDLICVSNGIRHEIENGSRISPKSIQTIYNPIDVEAIRRNSELEDKDIPERPYIIYLGRIAAQKRVDVLLQAFQNVKSGVVLVVLTNNQKKLNKLVKKHNTDNRQVTGLDFKQNPYPLVKNAKALVLSSDYEGLGMVLIEALACGTPVVSTDCPHGPNEILVDELAQFLSPVGDPRQLAEKIDLAVNYQVTTPSILENVDLDKVVDEYLSLLEPAIVD
jgi:glycosyltransferase involved in cell wall biosynthesis